MNPTADAKIKSKVKKNKNFSIPKSLKYAYQSKIGRSFGKITSRHKCTGTKKKFRNIDFQRNKRQITGEVVRIEYDPMRSAKVALIKYQDGEWSYILAAEGMKIGQKIQAGNNLSIKTGNRMPLAEMPLGTEVYNIELEPGRGGQLAKSAGSSATILARDDRFIHLKLPSTEIRKVLAECMASVGRVSNSEHSSRKRYKAGLLKYMGRRPKVRGKAMAPNAHPHGGGEGVNPIGLVHPKTPWGKPAMGYKTRKNKRSDKMIVRKRRK